MKIGAAARAAGLTAKQVRHYDDSGVTRRAARTPTGYRDFNLGEVERLVLVRRLRELDLSLDEIRQIVGFCFGGHCDLMNVRLREAIVAHRNELDRRRSELDRLAGQFDDLLARLAGRAPTDRGMSVKLELEIRGLHCTGCERSVERAVARLDGVHEARADHRVGRLTVDLVPGRGDEAAVRRRVGEAAFEVMG